MSAVYDCAFSGFEPCGTCVWCQLEALPLDEPIPFALTQQAREHLAQLERELAVTPYFERPDNDSKR